MNFKITAGLVVLAAGGVALGLLGGGETGKPGDVGPEPAKVEAARVELRVALLKSDCAPEPPARPDLFDCWEWFCEQAAGGAKEACRWRLDFHPLGCADLQHMIKVDVPEYATDAKGNPIKTGKTYVRELPACLPLDAGGLCHTVDPAWLAALEAHLAGVAAQEAERAKCPGGSQAAPAGHGCLCMAEASAEAVADEAVAVGDLPAKDRVNLVVCCDHERSRVLRLPAAVEPGKECRIIGQPVSDFSMGEYETDFYRLMTAACSPCAGPGGVCPDCLCQPGGCAAACR
ncbi:MAG: hypothetical protein WC789_07085 [Lentisphaeria bacterium]